MARKLRKDAGKTDYEKATKIRLTTRQQFQLKKLALDFHTTEAAIIRTLIDRTHEQEITVKELPPQKRPSARNASLRTCQLATIKAERSAVSA